MYMNIKIEKKRAIEWVILLFALLCILAAGPAGVLDGTRQTAVNHVVSGLTPPAGANQRIQQVFIADGGYLEKLSIYAENDLYVNVFHLTIYDELGEVLFYRDVTAERYEVPGYFTIPVNFQTAAGRAYVWEISHPEWDIILGWQNTAEAGIGGLGNYYYVDENAQIHEQVGRNVLMKLTYSDPLSTIKKAAIIVGIVMISALLVLFTENHYRQQKETKYTNLQWILKCVGNPLTAAGALFLLYRVHTGFYRDERPDRIIYTVGILLFSALLFYVINARRKDRKERYFSEISWKEIWLEHGMDWLQTAAWAGVLWGCIDYVNALYSIYQSYAYRKTWIFFGLVLVTMCRKENLFRLYNLIWVVASAAAGFCYCRLIPREAEQAKLAELNAILFVVIGLVAIQAVQIIRQKRVEWKKIAIPYAGLILVFFALLLIFKNTRVWPPYLVISFVLLYLFYLAWDKKERFLEIFCNGVILNFVCALIFAVLRRPFRSWYFYRYNFVFHTVTITATYLTLVLCVLFIKLLMKYHKDRRFLSWCGTGILFGTAGSLLIMTLSRTGYLAAVVMGFVMLIFVSLFCYRDSVKVFAAKTAALVLLVLACFPVTYSAVLLVPPLYDDPHRFDVEEVEEAWAIYKGDSADSENYITFSRFAYCFDSKLFGEEHHILRRFVETFMADTKGTEENVALGNVSRLLVSSDENAGMSADAEQKLSVQGGPGDAADYTNGRLEIFGSYIKHWNLTGHDTMGVELPDGSLGVHAHNTYLQVIHDNGLITGIVFLLVGIVSVIQMFRYAWINLHQNADQTSDPYAALPLAIMIAFAVAGLVEWLFHPCNPLGFSAMAVLTPFMTFQNRKRKG